ncbi:MAG: transposase [Fuerstiella sp.]|nr:transposase [Fuerstiella sp.]MCP4855176.1 transposase [Fuerstiella sp.]
MSSDPPWKNVYGESFHGQLRDELLNGELFLSLAEALWIIDRWQLDYNYHRLHSSIDYQAPAASAARSSSDRPAASLRKNTRSLNSSSLTGVGTKIGVRSGS